MTKFKIGDKVRYYSIYSGMWKYGTIEDIDEEGKLWARWSKEGSNLPNPLTHITPTRVVVEMVTPLVNYEDEPETWI